MSVDENTKEKSVEEAADKLAEELAAALAEEVVDETVEEVAVETVEEAVAEAVEEAVAEAVEENVEEAVEETEELEKPKKKIRKGMIITLVSITVVLAGLAVAYFVGANHYKERFFYGTTVNGIDCSDNTLKQVEATLQKQVEEYALTIVRSDRKSVV